MDKQAVACELFKNNFALRVEEEAMLEAKADGRLVQASPDSPENAQCPACDGAVTKRRRQRMDGSVSWFYRHGRGESEDCSRRYIPVGTER